MPLNTFSFEGVYHVTDIRLATTPAYFPPTPRLVNIETNPGPTGFVSVSPASHRPPGFRSAFLPRAEVVKTVSAAVAHATVHQPSLPSSPARQLDTAAYSTDGSRSPSPIAAVLPHLVSDSSVTSDDDLHPAVASIHDTDSLEFLPPPKFVGFLVPPSSPVPPPEHAATICAVDTMCLGDFSVVSKELVRSLALPTTPFHRTSRTATGALVKCHALAEFLLVVFISGQWHSYPVRALVWDVTSQPILLCNAWALSSGLIDMVQPNPLRCSLFGPVCLCWKNWETLLHQIDGDALDVYHVDVMPESDDDLVDLSAPLRIGDQDVSSLPQDARDYAARFPVMTKALPFHAHPDLDKWKANVVIEDLAKYSWPKCDLQDLKEDKFPLRAIPAIHGEFDKLISQGFVEEIKTCPTSVVMKAQLVSKTKTEKRFCVNGSQQKKVLRVGVYPMPSIRNIFAFVAAFPWRAKIDLKWGYYNFEIAEDDRIWTVTIGAGRAVQWRKLVQGFASSGAFFQYAMTKMLGPSIAGVIAQVYLDDLIIVGATQQECAANVLIVMTRLHHFGFRVNFAKCQFTPSMSIDFLGCRLTGNVVHPGPKVSTMLERIKPFYLQPTPKGQRHHLHVFNGMCAYLLQHCPGLKQCLHPLYLAVAAEPFRFGDTERLAFDQCRSMLCNLQVYHLPSEEPGYIMEIHSDASGGAGTKEDPGQWGAVLGQRRDVIQPVLAEGFELLQLAGGSFNERQAKWDILKKECASLYMAVKTFRHYTFGRVIRIIVDSKVLMYMHRSTVPMVQRWYAFMQSQDFVMIHFSSEANCFADALTRCTYIPPPARLVGVEPNPGPRSITLLSSDTSVSSIASDDDALLVNAVTRAGAAAIALAPSPRCPAKRTARVAKLPHSAVSTSLLSSRTPAVSASLLSSRPSPAPITPTHPTAANAVPPKPRRTRRPPIPAPAVPPLPPALSDRLLVPPSQILLPTPSTPQLPHDAPFFRVPPTPPASRVATTPTVGDPTVPQHAVLGLALSPMQHLVFSPPAVAAVSTPWNLLHHTDISLARVQDDSVQLLCHPEPATPSSLFHAIARALDHSDAAARAAGHDFDDPCPSHHIDDCRESVVGWLQRNRLATSSMLPTCPFDYRRSLYEDSSFGLYHVERCYQPLDWQEYLCLLLDPLTEPDELTLLAAAHCFRCEFVVCQNTDDDPICAHVFRPPLTFRRIFLTFDAASRHFNWAHPSALPCDNPHICRDDMPFNCRFSDVELEVPQVVPIHQRLSDAPDVSRVRRQHIAAAHCGHTGHPGVRATIALLVARGQMWRGMAAQVTQYISRCSTCVLARSALNPAQPAVATLRLSSRPLRRWHCDQTGTMTPCQFTGFQRIIAFICEATGYVVLFGSRHGTALEIAIALVHLVGTYGLFDSFHSDNGSENDNFTIQQFCAITGVKHTTSVPCNPETNGLVERGIQTTKRFLRVMLADGLADHNAWGFLIPMVQKAVNSSPFGPLQVPPSSVVFASLYCPHNFIIPSFHEHRSRYDVDCDIADGNHYHPSANFIHRASYFQQVVNSRRQEIMDRAIAATTTSPAVPPSLIAVGSQVLIPWPSDRRPTSMHPYRRGPYIVLRSDGNVLSLQHASFPLPDGQVSSLRWSTSAQVFVIHNALARHGDDPSAIHAAAGLPLLRPIDCVLDFSLLPSLLHLPNNSVQRLHVTNQEYRCRLLGALSSAANARPLLRTFTYDEIKHTLAFDTFLLCHPFLTGHSPVASMPATWNPCAVPPSARPMHTPDIAAERALPLDDSHAIEDA
jgi:hypothetical protein